MHMGMRRIKHSFGFTLLELLVVIAITAMLLAVMLPGLRQAKKQAQQVVCLNHLRQCGIAAGLYTQNYNEFYPVAYRIRYSEEQSLMQIESWDFSHTTRFGEEGAGENMTPGLLWESNDPTAVQQCPGYKGGSNSGGEQFTGYNYNTSYIGHGSAESIPEPAKAAMVRSPARTALFGDGQYGSGANKYMRAPWENPGDCSFVGRYAGTQGFRHRGQTNVAFCDGHVESLRDCFKKTYTEDIPMIAEGTGFLSADNSMYDLK